MLVVYALVILAADVAYGDILPITDCSDDSSRVKMTEVEMQGYPPFVAEEEKYITFKFQVVKPTSADLLVNCTSTLHLRCSDGKEETVIGTCNKKYPYNCVYFKDGICKRVTPVGSKEEKQYVPCEKQLTPGDYQVTITIAGVKLKCKVVGAKIEVAIMDGSNTVGCFVVDPKFN